MVYTGLTSVSQPASHLMTRHRLYLPAPRGVADLLLKEVVALGGDDAAIQGDGVEVTGDLELAYRLCLWSRLANRVLLELTQGAITDADGLYAVAQSIPWTEHLAPSATFAIDFTGNAPGIRHSRFGAQRIKDAIVDQFRAAQGRRPSVDTRTPDLRIAAHGRRGTLTLSIDLAGESLHRRGYRQRGHQAPLKENLAAAMLLRAGWPQIAAAGGPLVDPMCGSGTFLIEAAWMAAGIPPGLGRQRWGFLGWRQHVPTTWRGIVAEGREQPRRTLPPLLGFDRDAQAIRLAADQIRRSGLQDAIRVETRPLERLEAPDSPAPGLLITNPPYGERLQTVRELRPLYQMLGEKLLADFVGWQASVLTSNDSLGQAIGLRARRRNKLKNGPIDCTLLHFEVEASATAPSREPNAAVEQFVNRLTKNEKRLSRWRAREEVSCYRLYDKDLPEYAVAVDRYGDQVVVHEYAPPASVDARKARLRLEDILAVLPDALGVPAEAIHLRTRRRQRGPRQYEKVDVRGRRLRVREAGLTFLVNLTDYLDTGLFLDHRPTRALIRGLASGRHFLNLFCYTGAATVYAAAGKARTTTSVDMSNTYVRWAEDNLRENGFEENDHRVVRADCLAWIRECRDRFDLIFVDPPTFSRSKRMETTFDVQRDHVELLEGVARLLAPEGEVIFSNNLRTFSIDRDALGGLEIEDITGQTIPEDFKRNPRIHNTWRLTRKD